jgi:hypothetical protein
MIRPSSPPTALRCGRPARGLCGAAGRDRSRLVEAVRRDIDRAYRGELGLLFREIFTEEGTTLIPITDRYRSETDVRDCNLIDLYIRSKAALDTGLLHSFEGYATVLGRTPRASQRLQRSAQVVRHLTNRTSGSPASGSRTRSHAFTHGTSCPSRDRRTRPKCPYGTSRRQPVFLLAGRDNPERSIWQRLLKRECILHRKRQPLLNGFGRRKNDRHGLGMDRAHFRIGIRRKKPEQLMLALNRIGFRAAPSVPYRPDAGEERERAIFIECKMLRMLVIGAPPNCGGPGMPQRASMSSRTPSGALRTIGAG